MLKDKIKKINKNWPKIAMKKIKTNFDTRKNWQSTLFLLFWTKQGVKIEEMREKRREKKRKEKWVARATTPLL
jgi:hypothetical protein